MFCIYKKSMSSIAEYEKVFEQLVNHQNNIGPKHISDKIKQILDSIYDKNNKFDSTFYNIITAFTNFIQSKRSELSIDNALTMMTMITMMKNNETSISESFSSWVY